VVEPAGLHRGEAQSEVEEPVQALGAVHGILQGITPCVQAVLGDDDTGHLGIQVSKNVSAEELHVLTVGHDGYDDAITMSLAADSLQLLRVLQWDATGPSRRRKNTRKRVDVDDPARARGLDHRRMHPGLGRRTQLLARQRSASVVGAHRVGGGHGVLGNARGADREYPRIVGLHHRHIARRAPHPAELIQAAGGLGDLFSHRVPGILGVAGHSSKPTQQHPSPRVRQDSRVSLTVTNVSCVIVDIEGTTSATSFVYDRLFPYSRARIVDYLDDPRAAGLSGLVAAELGAAEPSRADVVAALHGWIDADAKITPLKTLQGIIWEDGFACGDLVSHLFADVAPALVGWHRAGLDLYVYSSGSVLAQRAWFGHTDSGNLNDLFTGNFDTANAGPKREASSYARITEVIGQPGERLLFLSDVAAELDAAITCGWQVAEVSRPGEPHPASGRHPSVSTFADITID